MHPLHKLTIFFIDIGLAAIPTGCYLASGVVAYDPWLQRLCWLGGIISAAATFYKIVFLDIKKRKK